MKKATITVKEAAQILDISLPYIYSSLSQMVDRSLYDLLEEYHALSDQIWDRFKSARGSLEGKEETVNIVNESGLYNVILRFDKLEAKKFKRWITHEVLPTICKTGAYTVKKENLRIKEANAKTRQAYLLARVADKYPGTTYQQVLHSHATVLISGKYLLPLPKLEAKTYAAEEIDDELGISRQMVGILTNRHNLKTGQCGAWFNDKAKGQSKEVQRFRYCENVLPVLEAILHEQPS